MPSSPGCDAIMSGEKSSRELQFKLEEEDYLGYYMYSSALSVQQRNRRRKIRIWTALVIALAGCGLIVMHYTWIGVAVLGVAMLWYSLYTPFRKWSKKRSFRNYIRKNLREKVGREVTARLEKDAIICTDVMGDQSLRYSGAVEVAELPGQVIVRFREGMVLILPKRGVGERELKRFVREISSRTRLKIKDCRAMRWS